LSKSGERPEGLAIEDIESLSELYIVRCHRVPLVKEVVNDGMNMLFKVQNVLLLSPQVTHQLALLRKLNYTPSRSTRLREHMRDDLPLPSMFLPISGIEQTSTDGDESIIKIRLDEPRPVSVYNGNSSGGSDRDMIGS
jgi:hypothetical protein